MLIEGPHRCLLLQLSHCSSGHRSLPEETRLWLIQLDITLSVSDWGPPHFCHMLQTIPRLTEFVLNSKTVLGSWKKKKKSSVCSWWRAWQGIICNSSILFLLWATSSSSKHLKPQSLGWKMKDDGPWTSDGVWWWLWPGADHPPVWTCLLWGHWASTMFTHTDKSDGHLVLGCLSKQSSL